MDSISVSLPKQALSYIVAPSENLDKSTIPFVLPAEMSIEEYRVSPLLKPCKVKLKLDVALVLMTECGLEPLAYSIQEPPPIRSERTCYQVKR